MRHTHCTICNKVLDRPDVTLKVIRHRTDWDSWTERETLYYCWACANSIDLTPDDKVNTLGHHATQKSRRNLA